MASLIFVACTGLIIGSFFNVVIWRLPRKESIILPASHCPNCSRKIRPWENIPLFSFAFLRGKCAGCKIPISFLYPVVEIITAAAACLLWIFFSHKLPANWYGFTIMGLEIVFLISMIPISIIDFKHMIIPDEFNIPMLIVAFGFSFLPGGLSPVQSLIGLFACGGFLFLTGLVGKLILKKGEAMGGGDVKLMAAAGALWGAQIVLPAIVIGALLGSIGGAIMMLLKRTDSDHRIPFGPFLGAGIWISVMAGEQLLNAYLGLVGITTNSIIR